MNPYSKIIGACALFLASLPAVAQDSWIGMRPGQDTDLHWIRSTDDTYSGGIRNTVQQRGNPGWKYWDDSREDAARRAELRQLYEDCIAQAKRDYPDHNEGRRPSNPRNTDWHQFSVAKENCQKRHYGREWSNLVESEHVDFSGGLWDGRRLLGYSERVLLRVTIVSEGLPYHRPEWTAVTTFFRNGPWQPLTRWKHDGYEYRQSYQCLWLRFEWEERPEGLAGSGSVSAKDWKGAVSASAGASAATLRDPTRVALAFDAQNSDVWTASTWRNNLHPMIEASMPAWAVQRTKDALDKALKEAEGENIFEVTKAWTNTGTTYTPPNGLVPDNQNQADVDASKRRQREWDARVAKAPGGTVPAPMYARIMAPIDEWDDDKTGPTSCQWNPFKLTITWQEAQTKKGRRWGRFDRGDAFLDYEWEHM